ncbi:hypothetical protein EPUS_01400 [Endocarpon pusillum Z07020]|uniref:Uncharacterized protein n=1 Tax=Endocarpon pusillum (strain Z07020 / HMAS-L-300199) TaxID=1263415 RepID=U1GEL1_ENDPU|nr:uncharacterized protein EPUS_01400 [Endocarpon pusillum Z07020]ERF76067.1 hypothetical protein EPUS_01400 [Endocarpon pusillum Z07020]
MARPGRQSRGCVSIKCPKISQVVDGFINLIVGRGLADQRDTARYERSLLGAEARNKLVKEVVFESYKAASPCKAGETKPLLERTVSLAGTIPQQGSIRPPRVRRRRLGAAGGKYVTPMGPPDISCADIPEEQLSRTYSRSCVWDPKTNPVPPMQEMEGFGRFRRSVHADANWQLNKYRGDLQTLGPVAVQRLGDFEIAKLKDGVMNNIRTSSYTSLASRSDSGESSTCPRICRGFSPAMISSISKASKGSKGRSLSPKRSSFRTTSPNHNDGTNERIRPQYKRTSFLRFEAGSAPLATIDEAAGVQQKKKTVPLIFDEKGAADAVIDDEEYETYEESFALAKAPTKPIAQNAIKVSSNWHEKAAQMPQAVLPTKTRGSRLYRTFDHAPEKARVVQKKSTKVATRRLSSRGGKALANRVIAKDDIIQATDTQLPAGAKAPVLPINPTSPSAVVSTKPSSTSSDGSADTNKADATLYIATPKASTAVSNGNNDALCPSNRANQPVTTGVPHYPRLSSIQGRQRSNTAFRVRSGNIPTIYLEGNAKHLLDTCEIDRKPLQPMPV